MAEITILKTKVQIEEDRIEQRTLYIIQRSHEAVANVLLAEGFDLENSKLDDDLSIVNYFLKAAIEAQLGIDNEIAEYMTKTSKRNKKVKL